MTDTKTLLKIGDVETTVEDYLVEANRDRIRLMAKPFRSSNEDIALRNLTQRIALLEKSKGFGEVTLV